VEAAARAWHGASPAPAVVIASGGRAWAGAVEADALASALVALGVPRGVIARERCSHTTRDNARFTAAACARRGIGAVVLVSCGWHLERARACFEREGLDVLECVSAGDGEGGRIKRAWVRGRERVLGALEARTR